jgi:hypothetical protein
MAVALVALIAFVILKPGGGGSGPPNAPVLDYRSYQNVSKSHEGNTNKVIGMIQSRQQTPDGGTLLRINWEGAERDDSPLGIFVSPEVRKQFDGLNLDVSNSYEFTVRVEKGYLEAIYIASK